MPLAAEKERRFVDVPVLTVFHSISLYFISSFRIIQFVQSTPLIIIPNLADQCNIRALVATSQPRAAYDPYRVAQDKASPDTRDSTGGLLWASLRRATSRRRLAGDKRGLPERLGSLTNALSRPKERRCQFSQLYSFLDQIHFPSHSIHSPLKPLHMLCVTCAILT